MANKKVLDSDGLSRLIQLIKQSDEAAGTPDGVTLSKDESNKLYILDGAITGGKIASGAVTSEKIADGAVTAGKLGADVVNGTTIVKNAQGQISLNGVDASNKILASSLSDDVWAKVSQIIDSDYTDIINTAY